MLVPNIIILSLFIKLTVSKYEKETFDLLPLITVYLNLDLLF